MSILAAAGAVTLDVESQISESELQYIDSGVGKRGEVDFYFDFISPYGWMGAELIGAIAHRANRQINWHPFLLSATVVDVMGLMPPLSTPLKGAYLRRDIDRMARFHGLPLSADAEYGFSSVVAARAVLWARAECPESVEALVLALYRAHWSGCKGISSIAGVIEIIRELGLPSEKALVNLRGEECKLALRRSNQNAVAAGVFGSPTIIVDGEMFWGADRLHMVEKWIESRAI